MHAPIPGWVNSKFQTVFFMAGDSRTADGAWASLQNQRVSLIQKIQHLQAQLYNRAAEKIEIQKELKSKNKTIRLKAIAKAINWNAQISTVHIANVGAKKELEFLDTLVEQIRPHRLYSHMDNIEAAEACQREEWLHHLIRDAENYLMFGPIPADKLQAMRMHPDFDEKIKPVILAIVSRKKDMVATLENIGLPKFLIEGPKS